MVLWGAWLGFTEVAAVVRHGGCYFGILDFFRPWTDLGFQGLCIYRTTDGESKLPFLQRLIYNRTNRIYHLYPPPTGTFTSAPSSDPRLPPPPPSLSAPAPPSRPPRPSSGSAPAARTPPARPRRRRARASRG